MAWAPLALWPWFIEVKDFAIRTSTCIYIYIYKSWPITRPQTWNFPNHGLLTLNSNHYILAQRSHQRLTNRVAAVQSHFCAGPTKSNLLFTITSSMHMRNQTLGRWALDIWPNTGGMKRRQSDGGAREWCTGLLYSVAVDISFSTAAAMIQWSNTANHDTRRSYPFQS